MNALFSHMTRKSLIVLAIAVGLGAAAGVAIFFATGDVTAAEGLTPGFIKGGTPVKPDPAMVDAGKKIYFRKCVWCHGVDGGGDGPGADRLWPRPRNFNQGTFKIRHTASGELPLFDSHSTDKNDLFQTVTHGLPGSAMPSWDGILTEQQRLQVLSFVTTQLVKDRKFDDKTETFTILDIKNDSAVKPIKYSKESIDKGKQLIVDKKCVECHGNEGRGDGNPFNLKDDWGFPIQPANWHKCWNFRGSRQDPYNVQNIFRTFSTGVNGTPMPSFADNTTLEERWHIANVVNSLCEHEKEGDAFSDPLSIDPLTDKPKINFVVPSAPIEGEIPGDPQDKKWQGIPRRFIGMGGQITHKPRNFVNRIDDIWVRSVYNKDEIAFMFQWDDRTKSEAAAGVTGKPIAEAPPKTGEPDSIAAKQNTYEVYNDAIAIQFPAKWEEMTPPEKPRYLHGEEKKHVDIWKWEANGTVKAYTGAGWDQPLEERSDASALLKVVRSEFKEGRWTVIVKRALKTEDKDADVQFQVGKYIPTVFFAWDGHNGDAGLKMAVSAFYYSILQQPIPVEAKVYPILMAVGMIIAEGWILRRRASKNRMKNT